MDFDRGNELEKRVLIGVTKRETHTLHVALEAVFNRDVHGNVWSAAGIEPGFWQRYLVVFDTLFIIARVRDVAGAAPAHSVIPQENISFVELPAYRGLLAFSLALFPLLMRLSRVSAPCGSFILRLPGAIGALLGLMLLLRRTPFAVELVGDPYDVLSGKDFSLAARLLRWPLTYVTQVLCRSSIGNTYVTERALQQRYPARAGKYADGISSIDLPRSLFARSAKIYDGRKPLRLFFCGSLAQLYKGLDVLIEAVALLSEKGKEVVVDVVGDGSFRSRLENLAKDREVVDRFKFRGQVPRAEVFAANDAADIFVMPSRTEGLPRAMVEAMARGMACIGTKVGGIPELLTEDALVPPGDAKALADAIEHAMDNPYWMNEQAKRNLAIARNFSAEVLEPRRRAFYKAIKRQTGAITP